MLAQFQQFIELNEIFHVLCSLKGDRQMEEEKDIRESISNLMMPLTLHRERLPSKCENIFTWKDTLDLRSIQYCLIDDSALIKKMSDIVWNKLLIGKQARQQNLVTIA
jgi:hypothetical protein